MGSSTLQHLVVQNSSLYFVVRVIKPESISIGTFFFWFIFTLPFETSGTASCVPSHNEFLLIRSKSVVKSKLTIHKYTFATKVCCRQVLFNSQTADCKVRPVHFMLTSGCFATKWFQWLSMTTSVVCFAAGHRKN